MLLLLKETAWHLAEQSCSLSCSAVGDNVIEIKLLPRHIAWTLRVILVK